MPINGYQMHLRGIYVWKPVPKLSPSESRSVGADQPKIMPNMSLSTDLGSALRVRVPERGVPQGVACRSRSKALRSAERSSSSVKLGLRLAGRGVKHSRPTRLGGR
eukprot:5701256-Pleurochrysis_carterae.AAC.1